MTQIAITIDVEWAHPEVLAYVVNELDTRGLRATFFCTHAGIDVGQHERALHPNYRRQGNSLLRERPEILSVDCELALYEQITSATKAFCPEAIGLRSHHLFWETGLTAVSKRIGIRYTSNSFQPLIRDLKPTMIGRGLIDLPIYYMDHWDLTDSATSLQVADLRMDTAGLKVLDFHPNLIYINARSEAQYLESKQHYHEPEKLLRNRAYGRGIQTLFLELLDLLAARPVKPVLLRETYESTFAITPHAGGGPNCDFTNSSASSLV